MPRMVTTAEAMPVGVRNWLKSCEGERGQQQHHEQKHRAHRGVLRLEQLAQGGRALGVPGHVEQARGELAEGPAHHLQLRRQVLELEELHDGLRGEVGGRATGGRAGVAEPGLDSLTPFSTGVTEVTHSVCDLPDGPRLPAARGLPGFPLHAVGDLRQLQVGRELSARRVVLPGHVHAARRGTDAPPARPGGAAFSAGAPDRAPSAPRPRRARSLRLRSPRRGTGRPHAGRAARPLPAAARAGPGPRW